MHWAFHSAESKILHIEILRIEMTAPKEWSIACCIVSKLFLRGLRLRFPTPNLEPKIPPNLNPV